MILNEVTPIDIITKILLEYILVWNDQEKTALVYHDFNFNILFISGTFNDTCKYFHSDNPNDFTGHFIWKLV